MKPMIVGGNIRTGEPSSVVNMLAYHIGNNVLKHNGFLPKTIHGSDLVIWAPDIPNELDKDYPEKDEGAVLICSKVIRDDRTLVDAVSRIFAMHANAVITIHKDNLERFQFRLIDALGNTWVDTYQINSLALAIEDFYSWSKGQVRISFACGSLHPPSLAKFSREFIRINTKLADKVENGIGSRYFGNFSTRCMKLFASCRGSRLENYLFSARNVDKKRVTEEDCVLVVPPHYYGQRKYSVDSPCQVMLYRQFDDINFMIHGHAFIDPNIHPSTRTTKDYYPCGDLREVEGIARLFRRRARAVNLRKHGFLLASKDLSGMDKLVNTLTFVPNDLLR